MTPYPRQVGEVDYEGYYTDLYCGVNVPPTDFAQQRGLSYLICTRPRGHQGAHVAHEGLTHVILAIDPAFDPLLVVSEGL